VPLVFKLIWRFNLEFHGRASSLGYRGSEMPILPDSRSIDGAAQGRTDKTISFQC
jgi:hypothetical protein